MRYVVNIMIGFIYAAVTVKNVQAQGLGAIDAVVHF